MSMGSTESLPFSEEAAGTGIESGKGAATAAEPTLDPQVAISSEQDHESGDYLGRLREGGDFAVEQTQNWQRKFNSKKTELEKVEERLQSVETLLPIVDQLGGAQGVIQSLERLGKAIGDPKMGPILQQFEQTGSLPAPPDQDEYVDPVEAELRGELQGLRSELAAIRGDTLKQSSTLAQQRITGLFQNALRELPLNEEQLAKVNRKAESTMVQWSGTPEGIRALENLDQQSVTTLIRGTLDDNEWFDVVRRMDGNRHEERQRKATDAPAATATGKAQSVAKDAIEACREAFKQEGLDPNGRLAP